MPHWLVSSTFYGQWLPGAERGSVTNVRDYRPGEARTDARIEHSNPGDDFEGPIPGLEWVALRQLKGQPVSVGLPEAEQLFEQFQETADFRGWTLEAVSIMFNHVHLIVEAPARVGKTVLLRDFKSYGARRLNQHFGTRASGTWWTDGGSARVVKALAAAIFYVCHRQPQPLLLWSRRRGRISSGESHLNNVFRGEAHLK